MLVFHASFPARRFQYASTLTAIPRVASWAATASQRDDSYLSLIVG